MNPYPGIRSFETDEDYLFFGRDTQILYCVETLYFKKFLAVIGSSGCGKSSLLRAGIIPSLIKGKNPFFSDQWSVSIFRPGYTPFENLARVISDEFKNNTIPENDLCDVAKIETFLRSGPEGLIKVSELTRPICNKTRLIVIDQFEELFRYRNQQDMDSSLAEASQFVALILNAIQQSTTSIYISFSMRSDFIDSCTQFPGLPEAISRGGYLVPRLTSEEKRLAIGGPAAACGGEISDALMQRLLEDVGNEPDQLPVLQHALMRTWDNWERAGAPDTRIDIRHYEAIGTIHNALSLHGEEIFNDLADERQQYITEKLFKTLTNIVQDGKRTRRPTQLNKICDIVNENIERVLTVIETFRKPGRAFLMPQASVPLTPESVIDITHESIMRIWGRLREWVADETSSVELYLRLCRSAELYQKGEAGLWVNPELQLGLNWMRKNKPNMAWADRYDPAFDRAITFLEHSEKTFVQAMENKEALQKRRLTQARRFAFFLGGVSIVSIMFLVVALNLKFQADASKIQAIEKEKSASEAKRKAERQEREALIQKKIAEQQQQIAEDQRLETENQKQNAIREKLKAEEQEAIAIRLQSLAEQAKEEAIAANEEALNQRSEALKQREEAVKQTERAEESERDTKRLHMLAIARSLAIQSLNIQKSGDSHLASFLALQAYEFNRANDGPANQPDIFYALSAVIDKNAVFKGNKGAVRSICVGDDSKWFFSCSQDGKVQKWNVHIPDTPSVLYETGQEGPFDFRCLAFNAANATLAAGSFEGTVLLWNTKKPDAPARILIQEEQPITAVVFTGTADAILVARGGVIEQWDITRTTILSKYQFNAPLTSLAYAPKTGFIACGLNNGSIVIFSNSSFNSEPFRRLAGNGEAITALAFCGAGLRLAAGTLGGMVLYWRTVQPSEASVILAGHSSRVSSVRFGPSFTRLITGSYDGAIRLWHLDDIKSPSIVLRGHDLWIYDIALAADGSWLLSASADMNIRSWMVKPESFVDDLCQKVTKNISKEKWDEYWNEYIGPDIPNEKTCSQFP
ncbi:MAG: hypothetical protein JW913_20740 [Chitinispirillaceae bacterium]|nr:hypothetical protein [Chitinispirillaceae bacterium]